MQEKTRHGIQNRMKPHMTNYWGSRIMAQLLYLEELNAAGGENLDGLLDALTEELARCYDCDGAITKQAALALEDAMRPASAPAKAITVSCVAHAHIDMNWQWRYDETAMLTIDTLRTMLDLMREYPAFTFAQSQASVYKIVEDYAPELLPEIRARIREGRWEVTASTWVETDKNMPNGESLTRHLLYTRQYLKELLGLTDEQFAIDYEPDTFGHGTNVPEILASGGVKYYYHCRGYDGHNLYRWRAPSGAEVTVYREPNWYIETISERSFLYAPSFCAKHGLDRLVHVYGVGDHGGGATRRDIERILDYNTWPCMPTITFGRYIDFFAYMDTLDLPVVDHELNFIFDGCYTSQSRIKKANRVSEAALFEAELFNSVSHLCGAHPYDAAAFGKLWKNVLFNQFHDILPGSGVTGTREHALGLFQETMAGAGTRKSAAVRAISAKINTAALLPASRPPKDSVAEGAGPGAGLDAMFGGFNYTAACAVGGGKRLFVLYNPAQTVLRTASTLFVWDWDGDPQKLKITDEEGQTIAHELLDTEQREYWGHNFFRVYVSCELPPFGYRTVLLEETAARTPLPDRPDPRVKRPEEYVLENEYVKAVFSPKSAALISFTDKQTGREYINGEAGGLFRFIMEEPCGGTAWNVGRHAGDTPIADLLKLTPVSGDLIRRFSFEAAVKNSKLKVVISLDRNARHLKYSAACDWRELGGPEKGVPQLAFRLPLAYPCDSFIYDNAFGVISRGPLGHDVPALSFAFAPNGDKSGLMLSSDSKYGFRCVNNAMSLTLVRSTYDPDPVPEIDTHAFDVNVGIVAAASPQTLLEASLRQNHAAVAVACGSQAGDLPLKGSFLQITKGEAVISSVKMPEDGSNALVVRLYSAAQADEILALEFFKAIKAAAFVDAHENELPASGLAVRRNGIEISRAAKGVTAVKVWF